jgi:hypothetical protein
MAAARARHTLTESFAALAAAERARFPDPYWMRVRDAIGGGLEVPWEAVGPGDPGDPQNVLGGTRLAQAARGLLRWDPRQRGDAPDGLESRLSPSARGVLDSQRPENRLFLTELIAWVELTQAPDGAVVRYGLVQTSGSAAYDRLVLARFAALGASVVASLGPPPADGQRTRWAVATRFELVPPAPVIGCGFDAVFRPSGCVYPLKRFTRTRVKLERLWEE